ncbi:hypothetical protein [Paenibacillus sp. GCM10027626]|uniref:hypothetical protein n=1 Tax=Paenibacillus sp. GCM10027626 TaxID=3273411 RepID=UPI00363E089C
MFKTNTVKWLAAVLLAFCILLPQAGLAQAQQDPHAPSALRPVQVFDVTAGKVVKTVENNVKFQRIAGEWLRSVSGPAPQTKIGDKCGYVFRLPLATPSEVKVGDHTVTAADLFMFYCPQKPQLLLVFDQNRKPYLLQFTADIKPFLKTMNLSQ